MKTQFGTHRSNLHPIWAPVFDLWPVHACQTWSGSAENDNKTTKTTKRSDGARQEHLQVQLGGTNCKKWVCLKMVSTPFYPMVLLIIIPMKNGYFIGNINPTFSDKPKWHLGSSPPLGPEVTENHQRTSISTYRYPMNSNDRFWYRWSSNKKVEIFPLPAEFARVEYLLIFGHENQIISNLQCSSADSSFHIFGHGFHGSNCFIGWKPRLVDQRLDGWRRDAKWCAKCCRVNSKIWPPGQIAEVLWFIVMPSTLKTIEVYPIGISGYYRTMWHLTEHVWRGLFEDFTVSRPICNPKVSQVPLPCHSPSCPKALLVHLMTWCHEVTVQNGAVCTNDRSNWSNFKERSWTLSTKHAGGQLL